MAEIIINKGRYECAPAVAAHIKQLERNNLNLQEEFYKQGAKIDELKAENARLEEELYQKSVGVIAATDCVECKRMRLIDADYVKSKLNKSALGGHLHYYVCGVIDDAPTIDAEPVKHGRWSEDDEGFYHCSVCKELSDWEHRYCPNCGAKMDLKDGESE